MEGLFTPGLTGLGNFTGLETIPADTKAAAGLNPQSVGITLQRLASILLYMMNLLSVALVDGTRWIVSTVIPNPVTLTGVSVLIGSTGGTDKLIVELHNAAGALIATSALAGVTAGTAGTIQQIPFTAPVTIAQADVGNYFLVVQGNGTTAKLATYNPPTSPLLTGSATGVFGTSAAITPPTAYTAAKGPVATLY